VPKLRILVYGDRDWIAYGPVLRALEDIPHDIIEVVIDGVARGADTLGNMAAKELSLPRRRFPANWKLYGRAAGPVRNQQMLSEGQPNLGLCFHRDLSLSSGSADMTRRLLKAGIEIRPYPPRSREALLLELEAQARQKLKNAST
jgi:hypothetical protein